jgi:hypothetical protein
MYSSLLFTAAIYDHNISIELAFKEKEAVNRIFPEDYFLFKNGWLVRLKKRNKCERRRLAEWREQFGHFLAAKKPRVTSGSGDEILTVV